MAYVLYINDVNKKARLHEEDCEKVRQHPGSSGKRGYYRYFDDYQEAWNFMSETLEDYDYGDCSWCNPE